MGLAVGFAVTSASLLFACGGDDEAVGGPPAASFERAPAASAAPSASAGAPSGSPGAPSASTASPNDAGTALVDAAPSSSAPAVGGDVKWSCDFENSYCGMTEQSKIEPAHRSTFRALSRTGATAIALTTEPGDDQVHGSGTWERDDLSLGTSPDYCNQDQEEWWAQSILFPDDYTFPPGPEAGIVMDFHHAASSGQANFEIQTIPGVGLRAEGHGGPDMDGRWDVVIADPFGAPTGQITKNRWYDFVYHVKWSANSDGFMIGWLNGKKVFEHDGPTLYTGISCYLKLANYHAPFGTSSTVLHDRVVRGTTAAAVALGSLEGVP